jgi:hypothetical protein
LLLLFHTFYITDLSLRYLTRSTGTVTTVTIGTPLLYIGNSILNEELTDGPDRGLGWCRTRCPGLTAPVPRKVVQRNAHNIGQMRVQAALRQRLRILLEGQVPQALQQVAVHRLNRLALELWLRRPIVGDGVAEAGKIEACHGQGLHIVDRRVGGRRHLHFERAHQLDGDVAAQVGERAQRKRVRRLALLRHQLIGARRWLLLLSGYRGGGRRRHAGGRETLGKLENVLQIIGGGQDLLLLLHEPWVLLQRLWQPAVGRFRAAQSSCFVHLEGIGLDILADVLEDCSVQEEVCIKLILCTEK